MLQLCDALEYAHNKKIAHRDIKPSNLLINKQAQLKLADFGIAASIAGTASTMTVSVLDAGTPSYMSPQQIEGRQPQAADDIYSLGATFYDLLTSKPPFYQGDVVHQVLNMEATPIGQRLKELNLQNEVPDYVSSMVMACLQKDPSLRPPTAGAVKKWIESEGKADFVAVKQVQWQDAPLPTQVSAAPAATPASSPTLYAKASRVVSDWLPAAKRKKVLAYGIVAAVMAVLIGTATWWTGRPKEINGVSAVMQKQLQEGLVAYYPFNGNANDESGNGLDGEVNGATLAADRHGKPNTAYSFDGTDDVIEIQEDPAFEGNSHAISLWFKSSTPQITQGRILICKDGTGGGSRQWQIAEISGHRVKAHVWTSDGMKDIDSVLRYTTSKWCHVIQVWDGKKLKLYVDGIFDSETPAIGPIANGDEPILIGSADRFQGFIDDVRIYNRALSEEEVAGLYDLEKPDYSKSLKEGLVAHYPFNGNANDESGNGYDGEVKGPKLTNDRHGKSNSAYRFDGGDGYIELDPMQFGDQLAISAWVSLDDIQRNGMNAIIVKYDGKQAPNDVSVRRSFGIGYGKEQVEWTVSSNGVGSHLLATPNNPILANTWTHLTCVWGLGQMSIHINGKKIINKPVEKISIFNSPVPISIGANIQFIDEPSSRNVTSHIAGDIDDVRIYNRALSAGEIEALYDLEKPAGK